MQSIAGLSPGYSSWFAITPSNTTLVTCRAIYVGTSAPSNVVVQPQTGGVAGTAVTFTNVIQGSILPVNLEEGYVTTATTASTLIGLQ